MSRTSLFHEEEQTLHTGRELLALDPLAENCWRAHFVELLSKYKRLLNHAKHLVSVGDLMQKDLNNRNELLLSAQERSEQLRTQLLHARKMEAIGTLTGGIAHDFNNLLTIINGYAEMILLDRTEDDPIYSDLQKILGAGRKGADMVKRLLVFSKRAELSLQPLALNNVVNNLINLIERTFPKMIRIEANLSDDLSLADVDAAQVEQVLMNLCINAKDAMPDGGILKIETKNVVVDEAFCRLHLEAAPGRYVRLKVSDTGTGMDKETIDRLFDPFFTTKGWDSRKGKGLGLSVAKGIVEQHGGWITCLTEQGVGTTFRIYFPAAATETEPEEPEAEAAATPELKKVLLVDDEEHVRVLGKRILERSGHTVLEASNGEEALAVYKTHAPNIGLVVLDLIMPQMGGEKCLEELLKINPNVKVIVSTGRSLDPPDLLRLGSTVRAFVDKPYDVRLLAQIVGEVWEAE